MNSGRKLIILACVIFRISFNGAEYCEKDHICDSGNLDNRYLFYDINPPEGFNLRRDVYLRFAVFAHNLQKSTEGSLNKFKLVLPPWTHLYHWRNVTLKHIPWSHFFDIPSLRKFAPVVEMYEFFQDMGMKYTNIKIHEVYILQHFEDMFKTGNFEDKITIEPCKRQIKTNFFRYDNLTSDNIKCLAFHGHASQLSTILQNSESKTILIDHSEIALHDRFGDKTYWQARRSMRFNKKLVEAAAEFRMKYLKSNDKSDGTERPSDWRDETLGRNAKGGSYLSVHLRRRDFMWSRPNEVPTIEDVAQQIIAILFKLDLHTVFIATDGSDQEYKELTGFLKDFDVYRFLANEHAEENYNNGQVAIIDQIICSHAKYFVGTHESTFSFRIQEEREIMGFPVESTFNRFCVKDKKCEKPSLWKITY